MISCVFQIMTKLLDYDDKINGIKQPNDTIEKRNIKKKVCSRMNESEK